MTTPRDRSERRYSVGKILLFVIGLALAVPASWVGIFWLFGKLGDASCQMKLRNYPQLAIERFYEETAGVVMSLGNNMLSRESEGAGCSRLGNVSKTFSGEKRRYTFQADTPDTDSQLIQLREKLIANGWESYYSGLRKKSGGRTYYSTQIMERGMWGDHKHLQESSMCTSGQMIDVHVRCLHCFRSRRGKCGVYSFLGWEQTV